MKENVYASRDISRGEPLHNVIVREKGYFYFFDSQGNALRAKHERRVLSEEVRKEREAENEFHKRALVARKSARNAIREGKEIAASLARAARKERLKVKIAALQSRLK